MTNALREFKAGIFHALAHPTRIAIVEALRGRERGVGALAQLLGVDQANVSQHLAVLRTKQVVVARKQRNQVYYSLRDRAITHVSGLLHGYFYRQLRGSASLLRGLEGTRVRPKRRP